MFSVMSLSVSHSVCSQRGSFSTERPSCFIVRLFLEGNFSGGRHERITTTTC